MYDGQTVGVVIPAYNEAGFVGRVIETLPAIVDRAYVVDDCSTDDTWSEIESAVATVNERSVAGDFDASSGGGHQSGSEAHQSSGGGHRAGDRDPGSIANPAGSEDAADVAQRDRTAPPWVLDVGDPSELGWEASLHTDGGQVRTDAVADGPAAGVGQGSPGQSQSAAPRPPNVSAEASIEAPYVPRIVAVRHDRNRGVGGAIKTGYRLAQADGLDVVAVMNGDGQMDPGILERIVEPVVDGRAAYAKGNRLSSATHRDAMPTWRLFGNGLLTGLTKCVSGYWGMKDPQNGYTAISNEALEAIDVDRLYEGYGFCNDVLVHLNVAGFRIEDVPMQARYGDEQSHIRYSRFVPTLSWLLARRAAWRYTQQYVRAGFHPLVLLLVLGVLAGGVGLASLGLSAATAGVASAEVGRSILLVLLGGLCLSLAVAADRLVSEPLGPGTHGTPEGDRS